MKPILKNPSVWDSTRLPKKAAPLKQGVLSWETLPRQAKEKFVSSFTDAAAFKERARLLTGNQELYFSMVFAAYQSAVEQAQNQPPSLLEMEVRENLLSFILHEMIQGRWHSLKQIAEYGEKYAMKGLRRGKFPSLTTLTEEANDILAVRILKCFADLSGVKHEDLLLPPIEDAAAPARLRFMGKANLLNPGFAPRGLPTKKTIERALQEESDSEVFGFSPALKKVGLNGLPKGGKGA